MVLSQVAEQPSFLADQECQTEMTLTINAVKCQKTAVHFSSLHIPIWLTTIEELYTFNKVEQSACERK